MRKRLAKGLAIGVLLAAFLIGGCSSDGESAEEKGEKKETAGVEPIEDTPAGGGAETDADAEADADAKTDADTEAHADAQAHARTAAHRHAGWGGDQEG